MSENNQIMSENNQMMSVEGQLVGLPLAGPESFSQQQLEYLKRALGVDETVLWSGFKNDIPNTGITTYTLSEVPTNFERVKILYVLQSNGNPGSNTGNKGCGSVEIILSNQSFSRNCAYIRSYMNGLDEGFTVYECDTNIFNMDTTTWTVKSVLNPFENNAQWFHITQIIGIHRIAGGNQ